MWYFLCSYISYISISYEVFLIGNLSKMIESLVGSKRPQADCITPLSVFSPVTTRLLSLSSHPLSPGLSFLYGPISPNLTPNTTPSDSDPSPLPFGTHGSAISRIPSILKLSLERSFLVLWLNTDSSLRPLTP